MLLLGPVAWAQLRDAAVHARPGDAGGLDMTHGEARTRHAGVEVLTTRHVRAGDRGPRFTDAECVASAAGVRAGEFSFSAA